MQPAPFQGVAGRGAMELDGEEADETEEARVQEIRRQDTISHELDHEGVCSDGSPSEFGAWIDSRVVQVKSAGRGAQGHRKTAASARWLSHREGSGPVHPCQSVVKAPQVDASK